MIDDRGLKGAMLVEPHREAETARFDETTDDSVCSAASRHAEAAAEWDGRVKAAVVTMEECSSHRPASLGGDVPRPALDRLTVRHISDDRSLAVGDETRRVGRSGRVAAPAFKYGAEATVRRLDGIGGVGSRTPVVPRVNVEDIDRGIAQALHRSWFFDVNPIRVSAEGGTVSLTGLVDSPHDIGVAFTIASAAVGVTRVENQLHVVGDGRLDARRIDPSGGHGEAAGRADGKQLSAG